MNQQNPPKVTLFAVLIFVATFVTAAFALTYPLLGTWGPEAGMLFGVVIGPLLFFSGAIRGAYRDQRGVSFDLLHEFTIAGVALVAFGATTLINGFFVSSCAPARGLLPFLIHAVPVVAFNSLCGLLIGRLVGRQLLAFLVALLVAATYLFVSFMLWWQSPSFRFVSHPLIVIDTDLWGGAGLSGDIIGFRAATFFFAIALLVLLLTFAPSTNRSFTTNEKSGRLGAVVVVLIFMLLGGTTHYLVSGRIEPGRSALAKQLSRETRRGQFVVHSDPSKTTLREAEAILAEADLWGARLRARVGQVSASDIHLWLYPDADSLKHYTGAANVHFALPAHREVHMVDATVPHPTLGHELAHVIVGEKSSTLLGVPGVLWILANQGLTEGLAVMLTPELAVKNDLTMLEQAAALAQAGKLPDLEKLFSISPFSFFASNTSVSYSVAGAYLEELVSRKAKDLPERAALINRLARKGQVEAVFAQGQFRQQFDANFIERLKALALPKDAVPTINSIFAGAPILSLLCDDAKAETVELPSGPEGLAKRYLAEAERIANEDIQEQQRFLERAGDFYWQAGQSQDAMKLWREIRLEVLYPAQQRSAQAKAIFSAQASQQLSRRALDYLAFAPDQGQRAIAAAMNLASELEKRSLDTKASSLSLAESTASYLVLRQRVLAGPSASDMLMLETLSNTKVLPMSFQIESLRLLARARALGPKALTAADQFRQIALLNSRAAGQLEMLDYAERAERIATALTLDSEDPNQGDIWLLGINRFEQ